MKPFRGTTFFSDGLVSRQPIQGTVPRGFLRTDTEFLHRKENAAPERRQPRHNKQAGHNRRNQRSRSQARRPTHILTTSNFSVSRSPKRSSMRGRERYDIFCSACHGLTGNGDGMIVRRGFRRAASFNDDRLRQAPVGHFFDAITNGWGAMPSYDAQIPVQDRWAIIAYIRALQVSQQNSRERLRPAHRPPLRRTNTWRTRMMQTFNPPNMSDFQKRSLIVGIVFLVGLLAGVFLDQRQFFQSYLIGWTFWTGIAVGSLALLMLQHLTGGGWGFVIRRILEAATRTLPLMAILFMPVILGAHYVYHHWTRPGRIRQSSR